MIVETSVASMEQRCLHCLAVVVPDSRAVVGESSIGLTSVGMFALLLQLSSCLKVVSYE